MMEHIGKPSIRTPVSRDLPHTVFKAVYRSLQTDATIQRMDVNFRAQNIVHADALADQLIDRLGLCDELMVDAVYQVR